MKMKHICLSLLILLYSGHVLGQSSLKVTPLMKSSLDDDIQPLKPDRGLKLSRKRDFVLCSQTKKQHGWFEPLSEINEDVAKHVGRYYKLSKPNLKGHWTQLETLSSTGNYATGMLNPYILKLYASQSDSTANQNWVEKLKTICRCEFVSDPSDPSGMKVSQERAYDEKGNLVYIFSRTQIDKRTYIGTYRDLNGLPAEMRDDPSYTYGTLVMLTEDRWGNDSIVQFLDGKGNVKPNSDNVSMEVYVHDQYGHLLKQMSCDSKGELTRDNWGNCGVEYKWDTKRHRIQKATYMDSNWKPMRMPSLRVSDVGSSLGVISHSYRYDKYGRQIEERFITYDEKPDTNSYGAHRLLYEFNDFGLNTVTTGYDLKGNVHRYIDVTAITKCKYNRRGRITKVEWFDANKQYIQPPYWCRRSWTYNNDNSEESVQYQMINGKELPCGGSVTKDNIKYTYYNDFSYRIDSLDNSGRVFDQYYYAADGTADSTMRIVHITWEYRDTLNRYTLVTEKHFDKFGKLVDDANAITYVTVDSLDHVKWLTEYDINENKRNRSLVKWDTSFKRQLYQWDRSILGKTCRAGNDAGTRYYSVDVSYTPLGDFATQIGRDEFEELDYISKLDGNVYAYAKDTKNTRIFYTDQNVPIENMSAFKDSCFKALSIEVIDTIAFNLGLKDNDIIIKYGNHYIPQEFRRRPFEAYWAAISSINAGHEKEIVIMRVDPDAEFKYSFHTLQLPKGRASEMGFLVHRIYRTKIQSARQRVLLSQFQKTDNTNMEDDDNANSEFMPALFCDLFLKNRYEDYGKEFTDPAIILAVESEQGKWEIGDNTDNYFQILPDNNDEPFTMHITQDGKTVKTYTTTWNATNANVSSFLAPQDIYRIFYALIHKGDNKNKKIKSKKINGYWRAEKDIEDGKMTVDYQFNKYGITVRGIYHIDTSLSNGANLVADLDIYSDGNWRISNDTLYFKMADNLTTKVTKISIKNLPENLNKEEIANYKNLFENHAKELLPSVARIFYAPQFLKIKDVTDNELIIYNRNGEIIFYKQRHKKRM